MRVPFAKLPFPGFHYSVAPFVASSLAGLVLVALGLTFQSRKGSLTVIVVKLPRSQAMTTVPP